MIKNYLLIYAKRNVSRWLVLSIDLFLVLQTFFIAYFIRFNFTMRFDMDAMLLQLLLVIGVAILSFFFVGSYKGIIRQTGLKDALNVYVGVSLLAIFMMIALLLHRQFSIASFLEIPLSVIIIHYLLNIITLVAVRFLFKYLYHSLVFNSVKPKNVMIYGAGVMGNIIYAAIQKDTSSALEVVGFIDEDPVKATKKIDRLSVYQLSLITADFIAANNIQEVIIAIQKIDPKHLLEVVDTLLAAGVKAKIAPPMEKWIDGDLTVGQIKQVKIQDLLERRPIHLDNPKVMSAMENKVVLITGAAGSIGSEIARQVSMYDYKRLLLVDQSESALYDLEQELKRSHTAHFNVCVADVRDNDRMHAIFEEFHPEIVFHAAAYKHVPLMESSPYEAVKINVGGTKIMADLALAFETEKFVLVSTDKAVNPTNVMGATKRIAEMYISCLPTKSKGRTKFITTRFGNVLGSNGSVIPLFKKQIEEGGPLTVTHKEITRYFMTIPEACELVVEAGVMGSGGEIFIFDMGASVKIYDLAKKMIKLSGYKFPEEMAIQITGLRPGEKLYEELLNNGENTLKTHHEKIRISQVKSMDCALTLEAIEALLEQNKRCDDEKTVRLIKHIVPEYISKNSVYCTLDV
jgi:FlaA1/EpsC-like NDP-sugar epimerase